jgi:hypothetical protein
MGNAIDYVSKTLTLACLASAPAAAAQDTAVGGTTVVGDSLRAQGRFLRGMAWYQVGTARAEALETAAAAEWNRSVQADYNRYLLERANRIASRRERGNQRQEQAAERLAEARRRWRENPTEDDIRSGIALNALAGDLADPAIPAGKWRVAVVDLPRELSIQSLAFRFADAPSYRLPPGMRPSTVALGRMKALGTWPIALRRPELEPERAAYRRTIAAVIATCVAEKPLQAGEVDAVRASLLALREKADDASPAGSGLAKQAKLFLDQLDEATKIFLDRDFAEELVRDAEGHQARTIGELLAFMKKYRLLFAEADQSPEVWAKYKALYELLRQQTVALQFADVADEPIEKERPNAQKPL